MYVTIAFQGDKNTRHYHILGDIKHTSQSHLMRHTKRTRLSHYRRHKISVAITLQGDKYLGRHTYATIALQETQNIRGLSTVSTDRERVRRILDREN